MASDGNLISPSFLLRAIRGKDQELVNRKSVNLMKLFYNSSSPSKEKVDDNLRYSWQPENQVDKRLVAMQLRSPNHQMPGIIEEEHPFSRSKSSFNSVHESEKVTD